MLVGQFDVRWTARGSHELLAFCNLFEQFVCFVAGSLHGSFGNFHYIGKSHLLQCSIYFFDRSVELSQNRRCRDGNYLFAAADSFHNVEYLRDFEDGSERTSVKTLAAVDTLGLVDMLDVVFIFADGFYWTCFFARYGDVYDSVVRTALVAESAADTFIVVDRCLSGLAVEVDGSFRAVHVAAACHTSAAEVTYFVVYLYTGRACLVDNAENVFLDFTTAFQCLSGIF